MSSPNYKSIARLHEGGGEMAQLPNPWIANKARNVDLASSHLFIMLSENGSLHGCNLSQTIAQTWSNMRVLYKALLRRVTLLIVDSQGHGTMMRARLRSGRLMQMATCRVADGATSSFTNLVSVFDIGSYACDSFDDARIRTLLPKGIWIRYDQPLAEKSTQAGMGAREQLPKFLIRDAATS
jgi:hypothetical protein